LVPTKVWPTHAEYELGRQLDASIASDKAAGKRVMVTHGAATLIRNGILDVPRDRALSISELMIARVSDFSPMKARFLRRYYDKIYVVLQDAPQYPQELQEAIESNYHEVEHLPGIPPPTGGGFPPPLADWDQIGSMYFLREGVRVMEVNDESAIDHR